MLLVKSWGLLWIYNYIVSQVEMSVLVVEYD